MLAFLGQIKAAQFVAAAQIDNTAVGVGDFFEILTGERVNGEHQVFDRGWQFFQINADGFIVARAFAGAVVTRVLNGTIARLQLAEPDQVEGFLSASSMMHEASRSISPPPPPSNLPKKPLAFSGSHPRPILTFLRPVPAVFSSEIVWFFAKVSAIFRSM